MAVSLKKKSTGYEIVLRRTFVSSPRDGVVLVFI